MSDNQQALSEEYYKGLETIVQNAQKHSCEEHSEDTKRALATRQYNQLAVPFNNALVYVFRNHIWRAVDEETLLKMIPFFQPIKPIEEDEGKCVTTYHYLAKDVADVSCHTIVDLAGGDWEQNETVDQGKAAIDNSDAIVRYCNKENEDDSFIRESLKKKMASDINLYLKIINALDEREIRLLESLLMEPAAQEALQESWEKHIDETELDGVPFELPANFFRQNFVEENPQEHFYLNNRIKAKGDEAFNDFINYLSEHDYISNSGEVKRLFAYRMTGRCRPDGDLAAIQWNGKNGKPYELIYVIRYFSERGDYKKMKRFFTGPEWVKDRDSSYANSADTEFRRFLWKLYPGVCC